MKAIRILEKLLAASALLCLLTVIIYRFDPFTGALLFFSWLLLALLYLLASYWLFGSGDRKHRPVLPSLLAGIGCCCCLLGWIPAIFNWPLTAPIYEAGIALLAIAVLYAFLIRRSRTRHAHQASARAYQKQLLLRVIVITSVCTFLAKGPREVVYPLLNINNGPRLRSEIALLVYKGEADKALRLADALGNKTSDPLSSRLYGEILLANGDSAAALNQFERCYAIDSGLAALNTLRVLRERPVVRRIGTASYSPYLLNDGLETASPEAAGVASDLLSQHFSAGEAIPLLNSLVVLKDNKVIAERYYHYSPFHVQWTFSVWKSIVSAMAGIAVEKGFIKSPAEKLSAFFPAKTYGYSAAAGNITVQQLLTMTSGIRSGDEGSYWDAADPAREILPEPLESQPGTRFSYASRNMFLVKELVSKSSTLPFELFCKTYADSLQLLRTSFPSYKQLRWDGSVLSLRDLAKLGQLFINNGNYNGCQIVPAKWVDAATQAQVHFDTPIEGYDGYGYFFWIRRLNNHQVFAARGRGGQFIVCVPGKRIVVASMGSEWNDRGFAAIEQLVLRLAEGLGH